MQLRDLSHRLKMQLPLSDSLRGLVPGLCLAAALAVTGGLAVSFYDGLIADLANGLVALIIAGAAGYRLCLCRDRSFAGWLLVFIAFDLLALAELSGGRLESLEHSLHIEDFDDIGLLLIVLAALVAVSTREKLGILQRNILVCGFLAQVVSTAIDLCDGWLTKVRPVTGEDLNFAADFSEFVFLQFYMVGIVGHIFTRAASDDR
jgi:hypothetical protein